MSDKAQQNGRKEQLLESVWAEARDLVRKLEGSTVERLVVAAGDTRIEIERSNPSGAAPASAPAAGDAAALPANLAPPPGPGPGISPGGRGASGAFAAITDDRIPILAPLVGTFYRSSQPGSKPFVEEGSTVEAGAPVCIVEAMKMMNEVTASSGGKVAEFAVENGEPVEFEQVLMYLEPDA
jgi:acetyl-CoA carboxylase biotin carboxyl carrier protein